MDDLFEVPGAPWVRVSPALATLRHQVLLAATGVVAIALVGIGLLWTPWIPAVGVPIVVVAAAIGWPLVSRSAASWAYAERDDDLFVRRGVAFRRIDVVPYGRMQLVDVTSGPLERKHRIATVHLHTAAPDTSARIPGLSPDEAARLRDRLTSLGEAQAAGL